MSKIGPSTGAMLIISNQPFLNWLNKQIWYKTAANKELISQFFQQIAFKKRLSEQAIIWTA